MRKHPLYKYVLAFVDVAIIYLSFVAALYLYVLVRGESPVLTGTQQGNLLFLAGYTLLAIKIFRYYNLYNNSIFTTRGRQAVLVVKSVAIFTVGIVLISFFFRGWFVPDSRLTLMTFHVISTAALVFWRLAIVRKVYLRYSRILQWREKALVIGRGEVLRELESQPSSSFSFRTCGFLSADESAPYTTFAEKIKEAVGRLKPSALIIAYDGQSYEELFETIDSCRKFNSKILIYSRLLNVIPEYVVIERYGDFTLVDISPEAATTFSERLKTVIDKCLSLAAIVVLSPLLVFLAAAVKLTSPGPVLYKQSRVGRLGRPFTFYKFRSMQVGSDADSWRMSKTIESIKSGAGSGDSTKVVNQSKVTPIGRFMRKTSLDELPQLFNVLLGDMSLVGPRPPLPYEWDHYSTWHKRRLCTTPGCTGLWQVTARSKVGFNDTVLLDLYYLYNRSMWLDMKILFQTFSVMALAKGGE